MKAIMPNTNYKKDAQAAEDLLESAAWAAEYLDILHPGANNGDDAMLTKLKNSLEKAGCTFEK